MTLLREWGTCVALGALLSGCGQSRQKVEPHDLRRTEHREREAHRKAGGAFVIEVGAAGSLSYKTPEHVAFGPGTRAAAKWVKRSERTVLRFDRTADLGLVRDLIETFTESHGFWHEITLAERDPDARYAEHEAKISLDKASYSEHEPILLTLTVAPEPRGSLLTPERISIQDERGRDVNIFHCPVSEERALLASFGATERIDLTSFGPVGRVEYVHRFAPGKYTATFHFSVAYPEWKKPFPNVKMLGPRVWGPKKSNTVSFEVRASGGRRPDTRALLAAASRLVEDKKWDEAVSAYKRAIMSTKDLASIRGAIRQIIRIRDGLQRGETERNPHGLEFDSLRLALLHVPEDDRREFFERYVRAFDRMVRGPEGDAASRKLLGGFPLRGLLKYPQFRKIIEEEVRRPDECPHPFAEVYVEGQGEKDPAVMAGLLPRYPGKVLEHYAWYKAPLEIVPLLPQYFGNRTVIWESGPIEWYCMDAAFKALELAAGLNLGYRDQRDRIPDREEIEKLMRRWWRRHRHEYGVTPGAGEDVVAARIAAIKAADEVWEGHIEGVSKEKGVRVISFNRRRAIKGGYAVRNPTFRLAEGTAIPETLLAEGTPVVVCLSKDESDPYKLILGSPAGIWSAGPPGQ